MSRAGREMWERVWGRRGAVIFQLSWGFMINISRNRSSSGLLLILQPLYCVINQLEPSTSWLTPTIWIWIWIAGSPIRSQKNLKVVQLLCPTPFYTPVLQVPCNKVSNHLEGGTQYCSIFFIFFSEQQDRFDGRSVSVEELALQITVMTLWVHLQNEAMLN